jgi:hypothetical protein
MADDLYYKLVAKWQAEGKRPRVTYQHVTYTVSGTDSQPEFNVLNSIDRVEIPQVVVEPESSKKKGKVKVEWQPEEIKPEEPKEGTDGSSDRIW